MLADDRDNPSSLFSYTGIIVVETSLLALEEIAFMYHTNSKYKKYLLGLAAI